jgi:hypothetical protein
MPQVFVEFAQRIAVAVVFCQSAPVKLKFSTLKVNMINRHAVRQVLGHGFQAIQRFVF